MPVGLVNRPAASSVHAFCFDGRGARNTGLARLDCLDGEGEAPVDGMSTRAQAPNSLYFTPVALPFCLDGRALVSLRVMKYFIILYQ